MERIRLNINLMEQLFEVAAAPVLETLSEAGIAQSTLWGWIDAEKTGNGKRMRQGGIPVLALINLCNAMRIPVRKLFVEEGDVDVIPLRSELVSLRSQFIPCHFDMEAFRKGFGIRSGAKMSVTSMLDRLGVSYTVYVAWIADAKNLRVQSLLDICNEFGYDFFQFVVDENGASLEKDNVCPKENGLTEAIESKERENASLLREIKSMEKDLKETLKQKEELAEENAALKIERSELVYEVKRLKEHLNLLLEGNIGLVAERKGIPYGDKTKDSSIG